jgi:hypothetical protein
MVKVKAVNERRQCKRCAAFAPREVNRGIPVDGFTRSLDSFQVRVVCCGFARAKEMAVPLTDRQECLSYFQSSELR